MIFTSTTRESVERPLGTTALAFGPVHPEDPEPWVTSFPRGPKRWAHPASGSDYDPRPGYRAPANPILVAFREVPSHGGDANPADWAAQLATGAYDGDYWDEVLPEHIEHARKVLQRLAGLS